MQPLQAGNGFQDFSVPLSKFFVLTFYRVWHWDVHIGQYRRNRTQTMLSVSLCVRFHCETTFMDAHTPFLLRVYDKIFCHTMTSSLTNEHTRNGVSVLTSCHFVIHASHAMIILPYARIAWYRYAASTDDTEGGRAQRSPGSISMGNTHMD